MPGRAGEPADPDAGAEYRGVNIAVQAEKKEERDMWITMNRKEAVVNYLKCMGTGALCMAILLFLMLR